VTAGEKPQSSEKPRVLETVVVEGRDDMSAVLAAADANVIWTNGYGINQKTLDLISSASEKTGIVIFTDPDHAGRRIRERLSGIFPSAKQAYLTQDQAEKDGDIGIENAVPSDILRALKAAGCCFDGCPVSTASGHGSSELSGSITIDDLVLLGLAGCPGSAEKRARAGARLGIGTANSRTFLKRLNYLGIGAKELAQALKE